MTTTVKIDAHPLPDQEVKVVIVDTDQDKVVEEFTMQPGESTSRHVYGQRMILIKEMPVEK